MYSNKIIGVSSPLYHVGSATLQCKVPILLLKVIIVESVVSLCANVPELESHPADYI